VPAEDEGQTRLAAPLWAAGLAFVLGCSLLRFGIFVSRGEPLGVDPVLALAAAVVSAYTLARTLLR
jgi:hypothetical protein